MTAKTKVGLIIAFASIAAAAALLSTNTPPAGPWIGIYSAFASVWALLAVGILGLLIAAETPHFRLIGVAVALIAVIIGLVPLEWGSLYGIRDPWVHLSLIKQEIFFGENPYPALHGLAATVSAVLGVDSKTALMYTPVLAALGGVAAIFVLVSSLSSSTARILSLIAVFPAAFIGLIARPFTVAPLLVVLGLVLSLQRLSRTQLRLALLLFPIFVLYWHPIALVMFGLVVATAVVLSAVSRFPEVRSRLHQQPPRELSAVVYLAAVGTITATYLFFATSVGFTLSARLVADTLLTAGGTPPSVPSGESVPIIARIGTAISEFLRRSSYVILLGVATSTAIVFGVRKRNLSWVSVVSLASALGLVGLFVIIDLVSGIGFGPTRAVEIAPTLLIPGATIGFQRLQQHGHKVVPFALCLLLVTSGVLVTFGSPYTGTNEYSTTKSDEIGYRWVNEYKGDDPVIGSESTYYVIEGLYSPARASELANGQRWRYQWWSRKERFSWDVRLGEDALVAVSPVAREIAAARGEPRDDLEQFRVEADRVYTNGNLWIHHRNSE